MQKRGLFLKQQFKKTMAVTLSTAMVCGAIQIPVFAGTYAQTTGAQTVFSVDQSADQSADQTPAVQAVQLQGNDELVVLEGKTVQLDFELIPQQAVAKTIEWSSDCTDVATVDKNGLVTGLKEGTAKITVTVDGKTDECTVHVKKQPIVVSKLELNITNQVMTLEDRLQLIATVSPSNADNKKVNWSVQEGYESIVSVSENGFVTPKACGFALVVAETEDGGYKAYCQIEVRKSEDVVPVQELTLSSTQKTVTEGTTFELIPNIQPSNATNQEIVWDIDHPEIVQQQDGKFVALAAGTAQVTVSLADGTKKAVCEVTVEKLPEEKKEVIGVKLSRTSTLQTTIGKSYSLKTTITPSDATNPAVTFKSSNSKVLKITKYDNNKGTVTVKTVGAGTATITATSQDDNYYTSSLTVVVKPNKVTGLKAKKSKSSAKVTWTKATGVSGYEVYVYNKKTKKVVAKTATTKNSYTLKKTKNVKNYGVKVRAYVKYGSSKKYGSYSSVKAVTFK